MNSRDTQTPYQALFQFIQKNTVISCFLENLSLEAVEIKELLQAIQAGEANASIFSHQYVSVYLLYLMRENAISFNEGISAYVYVMALMQFSKAHQLKSEDTQYHYPKKIIVEKLVDNGYLTKEGEVYITEVCERLEKLKIYINKKEFTRWCLQLPKTEHWLIMISTDQDKDEKNPVNHFFQTIAANLPLIASENLYKTDYYKIPSTSVFEYVINFIMRPIFGCVGFETLLALHQKDEHPLPLYSPFVKNNMLKVHGLDCGPFVVWIHDIAHTFWAGLLSKENRNLIFNLYIPQIKRWREDIFLIQDVQLEEYFDRVIHHLPDFDLSPICKYQDPEWRFIIYLLKSFDYNHPNQTSNAGYHYAQTLLDKFIYFVLKEYYSDSWLTEDKKNWIELLSYLLNQASQKLPEIIGDLKIISAMLQKKYDESEAISWPSAIQEALDAYSVSESNEKEVLMTLKTILSMESKRTQAVKDQGFGMFASKKISATQTATEIKVEKRQSGM